MAWGRASAAAENRPHDPRQNQPGLHNQLDYIAVPKRMLPLLTDARGFLPHVQVHRTDHSLVVATVRIRSSYRLKKLSGAKRQARLHSTGRGCRGMGGVPAGRRGYIEQLRQEEATSEHTPAQQHEKIKKMLSRAVRKTLPEAPTKISG